MVDLNVVVIPISAVTIEDRLRAANQETVSGLAADITERGLRSPIEVANISFSTYRLVSGLHRILACQSLGMEEIPAFIVEGTDADLLIDEILENMTRRELSPLDRAVFTSRLKDVLSGQRGGDRRSSDFQTANVAVWSELAAQRTGWAPRTIERAAAIGSRLSSETVAALRGADLANNGKELEALSKFSPAMQKKFVEVLTRPERPARNVAAAQRELQGAPSPEDKPKADKDLQRLIDLWSRSSKSTQDAFLKHVHGEAE